MAKQTINIGTSPNDGTGTPLRTSFDYCNLNFTELYTATGPSGNNIVVPGNATITGDLTVDTSTLKVDSTNNRVIVGHTSGASAFQVSNAGAAGFEVQPTGVNSAPAILSYNRSGAAWIQLTYAASSHVWQNSGTDAMTLNSTSNLVLKGGTAAANGVGLTFPATQVASSDANCLDDYEEGTWTGTLTGSTTNPTVPVTATGKYTKIGRQVTVVIYFANVSTVGASGAVGVTGLPFTEDGTRAVGTAGFYNFDFNGGTGPFVDVSGTTMFFQSQLTNSNWRDVNHSAGAGRYLRATVTYFV